MVRNADVIFYVGQSQDVRTRLLAHMGKGQWGWAQGLSSLGTLVGYNLPESLDWQIELLTPGDCGIEPLMPGNHPFYLDTMIDTAERLLIARLHPCLNAIYNQNPSVLPECYKRPMPDLAVTASDFVPW